ncbi:hypothetical protein FACS1894199_07500 [Bacteroidia bacterium]|nr:hypothetical protein FACS1894199_07500 [Bacteroidia bacterium]
MPYLDRFADIELADRLSYIGALLIEGPKFCGKTETARRASKSIVRFDVNENIKEIMSIDPYLLLAGAKPISTFRGFQRFAETQ